MPTGVHGQGRRAPGRYLGKMTGLSRAQLTRLVGRYLATGRVRIKTSHRHRFPTRYTRADVELQAQVDEAHQTLSGPLPDAFSSASLATTASSSSSAWPPSPTGICTTHAAPRAIASASRITKKRGPAQWPLASAAVPNREGAPGICGWIRCTKATFSKCNNQLQYSACKMKLLRDRSCQGCNPACPTILL